MRPRLTYLLFFLAALIGATTARSQYQPWAVQWLQHASTAKAGRDYLGITNFFPGTNITFTPNGSLGYTISSPGGGTNTGNSIPNTGGSGTNLTTFGYLNAMGPVRMLGSVKRMRTERMVERWILGSTPLLPLVDYFAKATRAGILPTRRGVHG